MEMTAGNIAEFLKGDIEGNSEVKVSKVARIEQGDSTSLCFLANPKYEKYLYTTKASIVLINRTFQLQQPVKATLIRVDNAYEAVASVLSLMQMLNMKDKRGISWRSHVGRGCKLGKKVYVAPFAFLDRKVVVGDNVKIYPHVYIGENVSIGDNTIIYPGVRIYHSCKIGANCILHSGAVIGADGFGFAPTADGTFRKIPQVGNVVVEDDVEIGANTTIDRSTMGSTLICKGVKLDNLIQIAHNVEVGENTVIAAQTGIAGSSKLGRSCMIGGQVGIVGHLTLGNNVQIAAKSGIANNFRDNANLRGAPAFDFSKFQRCYAIFKNLPELRRELTMLKKQLEERAATKS